MQVDLGSRRGRESHLRKSQAFEAVGRSVVLRDRKVRRQVCRLTWSHPDKAFHATNAARPPGARRPPSADVDQVLLGDASARLPSA